MFLRRVLALNASFIVLAVCARQSSPRHGRETDTAPVTSQSGGHATGPSVMRGPHPWCSAVDLSRKPQFPLTTDSLGPVVWNSSKEELRRVCPGIRDTVWYGAEGDTIRGTLIRFFGKGVGLIEWADAGRVAKLTVFSPDVVTLAGLHVGSTMRDIRARSGRLSASHDDAGVYVWESDSQRGFSYLLWFNATEFFPSPDDVVQRIDAIPDSARVRSIILDLQR
jgi:hypothetical protein